MELHINREVQTEETFPVRRKLNLNISDSFSTPPSQLRKENSYLRDEIAEAHEFHDLELNILEEEHKIAHSEKNITIAKLQKSLHDAEDIILDSKKEISNLRTLNQELQQKLKEECNKTLILKEQYDQQISKLQLTLMNEKLETENLRKDKNDFEVYIQLLRKNYEQKIDELRTALKHGCEGNNESKEKSSSVSEGKLNNESDKDKELGEIRSTFEEEIKKLKDDHNNALKSFEIINTSLKQTNESLTEKLRDANEVVEGLKKQLLSLENETELLRKRDVITNVDDVVGKKCGDESEILDSIGNTCSISEQIKSEMTAGKELEGYKVSENKDSIHLLYKTVRYLNSLCSQLEESGSSLNLSSSSFDSFNEHFASSPIMQGLTEVEISAVNDATICNDPLALTRDNTLQTPFKTSTTNCMDPSRTDFKTPVNSVSKPLRLSLRTPITSTKKKLYLTTPYVKEPESNLNETELFLQLKDCLAMKDKVICEIKDKYMKDISQSEEILTNSLKKISLMEERIFKLENNFADLKLIREKLTQENCSIKELLNKTNEEIVEIRRKLIVEITSLNPQLEGTLSDVYVSKLLDVFLNSIMERCKKIPEWLHQKSPMDMETHDEKNEIHEGKFFELEKEINGLKEVNAALISEKDNFEKEILIRDEKIKLLVLESSELQSLKEKMKDLEESLEKKDGILKTEIYLKENAAEDLQKFKVDYYDLKLKFEKADKTVADLKINLTRAIKEHFCIIPEEELLELQNDEEQLDMLESILEKYKKNVMLMSNEVEALRSKLSTFETELNIKTELIETFTTKLEEANEAKLKCEDYNSELKGKVRDLEKEIAGLTSMNCVLDEYRNKEEVLAEEIRNLRSRLNATIADLEEARVMCNEDKEIISKLRAQEKTYESSVEDMINEKKNLSEKIENLYSDLSVHKAEIEEKTKVICRLMIELEQAKYSNNENEGIISELTAKIEKHEKEIARLKEFESTFEKLNEFECNMSERMDILNSRLLVCEVDLNEKILLIAKLRLKTEEAKKVKIEDEKLITDLKMQMEELKSEKVKAEKLELLIEKSKDTEEVLSQKVKDLNSRLLDSEVTLKENLQLLTETNLKLEEAESINTENKEVILELKKQLKNFENEKIKMDELQCIVENLKENEKMLLKKVEDLRSSLKSSETEKMELELRTVAEIEEAYKIKAEHEVIISLLRLKHEEFNKEKAKFEEFEAAMIKLKEKEEIMSKRMENLHSKLLVSEEVVNEKTETLDEMWNQITKAKLIKTENDYNILALQEELNEIRNLQRTLDAAQLEQRKKEPLIEGLHNKLNELNSEIECLREKLGQAESNLKLHQEKVIQLGEIENDLKAYREMVHEIELDCDKMKDMQNFLLKVTSELEARNKELEDKNSDLLQKQEVCEKLNENSEKEIKVLRESLSITEDKLRLKTVESANLLRQLNEMDEHQVEMKQLIAKLNVEVTELRNLETKNFTKCRNLEHEKENVMETLKEVQERNNEMQKTILNIGSKLDYLSSDGCEGTMDCFNFIAQKIDKLFLEHDEEVKNLKQELKSSKDIINNLQIEINNSNKKAVNESKSESFIKPKDMYFEKMKPLKSTPIIERSRTDISPPHKSRRLEKLENLNDLLNGTLQKISTTLNIPHNLNFFSVDCYEETEAKALNYIKNLKFYKSDDPKLNETRNEVNITPESYEEMCRMLNELKICVTSVVKYLELPEGVLSSHEIISQIEKIKCEIKAELLERIAVLRQDNQHLDDDNNLLQKKSKKLAEIVTSKKIKITSLKKSEELLRADVENLKKELLKYQGKNKICKINELCNRKLDRLEDLNQSLIDMVKKILSIMEMENVQELNLLTPRTFDIESRKIFDHVNKWILKKSSEVQGLKSQITEMDEECEFFAKKVMEDSKKLGTACEEINTLKMEKEKLEEEIKSLKSDLKKLEVESKQVRGTGMESGLKKQMENLKEENISLKSQIETLNNDLAESKKQREELDEECESLVIVIKQEGEKRAMIWEELKNEIKTLNNRIEKLEEEKSVLESEKKDLLKTIEAKETGTNSLVCDCRKQSKEVKELRSKVIVKDMRILELEQLNEKNLVRKTQMKALENSLSAVKKELAEKNVMIQKLQAEMKELSNQIGSKEAEIMEKLRIQDYGTASVNQLGEREKLLKLEKDNRMLKELCRTRYKEMKRLETENLSLKGHERITKNSNQMDSPIRTRAYNRTLRNN